MGKKVEQAAIIASLLLALYAFGYLSTLRQGTESIALSQITGAIVSEQASQGCSKDTRACPSYDTAWKCSSIPGKCFDYLDCGQNCQINAEPAKEEPKCSCQQEWQTDGSCGTKGCSSNLIPQKRTCAPAGCDRETRCQESSQCTMVQQQADAQTQPPVDDEADKAQTQTNEGVDLVPEISIQPPTGLKGGDRFSFALKIRNNGGKSTGDRTVRGKCTAEDNKNCEIASRIEFKKDTANGPDAGISAFTFLTWTVTTDILPGQSAEIASKSVDIPTDFSGKLVVVAEVNNDRKYIETAGGRNTNNMASQTIQVGALKPVNLVPVRIKPLPRIESLPATLQNVEISIKNDGDIDATSERFLETKASVFKGETEVCTSDLRRELGTIKANDIWTYSNEFKAKATGMACNLEAGSSYKVTVETDTTGIYAESNENDNKKDFALLTQPKCPENGKVDTGSSSYCEDTWWKPQKVAGQECKNNYECQFEYCIKKKCVSQEQKTAIENIVS